MEYCSWLQESKLIAIFNLLWSEFVGTNATFQSASTDLDYELVVCDLTQIPANQLPPIYIFYTHILLRYLGQVTDNQCVIKICRSRSKHRSFVSTNSLPSKLKITINPCNVCHLLHLKRNQRTFKCYVTQWAFQTSRKKRYVTLE